MSPTNSMAAEQDDPTSPSTGSESGDEAGTPLRGTMDQHRVDAIDSIMQSFCAVLDSKIALVKKTAVVKVEPDLDFSLAESEDATLVTLVPTKSKSRSPILQRKGLARGSPPPPPPETADLPKPAALGIKREHKKRGSFTPKLAVRRAPAPAPPPPPAPAPAPAARRRAAALTSSSDAVPSRTTDSSSSTTQLADGASTGSAPPQAPAGPASTSARGVLDEQDAIASPGLLLSNTPILHHQFFHLPAAPPAASFPSAPPLFQSTSRSALGFRAPDQSFQQESFEPEPPLERGIQIPAPEIQPSPAAPFAQRFRSRFSRGTPASREEEEGGWRAHQQDRVVADGRRDDRRDRDDSRDNRHVTAQFQGFGGSLDISAAPVPYTIQGFGASAQPVSAVAPAGSGLMSRATTRQPPLNQGPPSFPAVEPELPLNLEFGRDGTYLGPEENDLSLDLDLGHDASASTYLDLGQESFPAPGAPSQNIYEEEDAFGSQHLFQFSMPSESQAESIQLTAVSESTPPKPITPKAPDRDGRRNKRQKGGDDSEPRAGEKKFACPYYKRNKKKYSKWTSCPGPGWEEVHRVKTHLYRRHGRPPQCPRCWSTFSTDDSLHLHLQQNPPCETGHNQGLVEGFSKEQEKKLRSRKKAQPNMTDEDKWRDIYMILFPDDDKESIPSAYYDETDKDADESSPGTSGDLEDYATFVRREMPTLVRRELELLFENEFKDVEERLRPRVAEIVLNLQPKLLNLYKQSQTPLSEYGPPPPEETPGSGSEPVSHATGTDTNSTPGTGTGTEGDDNAFPGAENLQYFNPADMVGFDVNSMGAGFNWDRSQSFGMDSAGTGGMPGNDQLNLNWDYEFDQLLNPVLFSPESSSALMGQIGSSDGGGKRKHDANC